VISRAPATKGVILRISSSNHAADASVVNGSYAPIVLKKTGLKS
jgi:hypothetical protein